MDETTPSTRPAVTRAVYGAPPPDLVPTCEGARQVSPLVPGAAALEDFAADTLDEVVILAPPGTAERRAVLAQGLRVLRPSGRLTALAPKDRGGSRLGREMAGFGCAVAETAKRHHRICRAERPAAPVGIEAALAEGAPRYLPDLGLWTQPGIFSWNRIDPGTALLLDTLPPLKGRGADLGCGLGVIARAVLASPAVTALTLADIDRRAVAAARRNVEDPRAHVAWADARRADALPGRLDFVVTNPPFHLKGSEDQGLGQAFIRRAAEVLRPGGALWLTANLHLPYEAVLAEAFRTVTARASGHGYKVYEAIR
ncbi:methyltransferase small [Methylobacterium sp. 4-46]|uniref:class I SAM-dependent methyltransferase n=1 Tax=unclassified Methylobacterium TaxID=2615210 RepID=UPI000152D6D8|nr:MULTISPECIES: methyltransferase [Methylobacterium]ACA16568.1 methyltransferase small [Methylobacterium sp. 4-46]WFT82277.1 methyltransferase [Methylobacterium nodulans]